MTAPQERSKQPLLVEHDEAVTTISINDAPWNRMSFELMDELKQRAHEMALEMASMPPLSVSEVLRCVIDVGERSLAEGLHEERQAVLRTSGTRDNREGMMAFLEKRKPVYTGE